MRTHKLFPLLAVAAVMAGTSLQAQTATTRGFDTSREGSAPPATGIRRALIVGVDEYQDPAIPRLNFAVIDAMAFTGWLRSPAAAANVDSMVVLTNRDATRDAVMKHYRDLVALTQPGDELIVYFSGHGGVRQVHSATEGYLFPHDADGSDIARRGISLEDINKEISYLRGQSPVLLILDACRSGNLFNANLLSRAAESLGASVRRLVSSEGGQDSQEGPQWDGHGAFTYFLLNGLYGMADANGDGHVTLAELGLWVVDNVAQETNQVQVPQVQPFDHKWVITTVLPQYSDSVARQMAARTVGTQRQGQLAMRSAPPARQAPAPAPAAPAGPQEIRVGERVRGNLQTTAQVLEDGTYYDVWFYNGRRGERLSITMRSSQFDPYLILALDRPGQQRRILRRDDDGAGGTDARIRIELPEDGVYSILANGFSATDLGNYTLEVESVTRVPSSMQELMTAAAGLPTIRLGDTVTGNLTDASPIYLDETPFQAYVFEGRAGQVVEVEMRSSAFDSYLMLGDVHGDSILARDDDSLGNLDASIHVELPSTGRYVVMANSVGKDSRGAFALRVAPGRPIHTPEYILRAAASGTRRISQGETVSGRFTDASPLRSDRSHYEVWLYEGRAGETITVTMRSSEVDSYLAVGRTGERGRQVLFEEDDDSGGHRDAQVVVRLPENGTYAIVANTFRAGERGSFTLEVSPGGTAVERLSLSQAAAIGMRGEQQLAVGGSLSGTLSSSRVLASDQSPVLPVLVRGRAGERVTIDLRSSEFDTYLIVTDAAGNSLGSDDDGGDDTNSRLSLNLPADGVIVVLVNSYDTRGGRFDLRVERADATRTVALR